VWPPHPPARAAVAAANDAGIWSTGYDAPMGEFGGDRYLTSPVWHWEKFYEPTLQSVRDDSWESDFYFEGLESGIIALDDWGPSVPEEVQNSVSQERSAITEGDRNVWEDSTFADADDLTLFQEMNSYVDGVEGEVPD
jgi:basic membrane protein A